MEKYASIQPTQARTQNIAERRARRRARAGLLLALTVLNEGEDRVPYKVGRDLVEVDQQSPEDNEGHQNLLPNTHARKHTRRVEVVGARNEHLARFSVALLVGEPFVDIGDGADPMLVSEFNDAAGLLWAALSIMR